MDKQVGKDEHNPMTSFNTLNMTPITFLGSGAHII